MNHRQYRILTCIEIYPGRGVVSNPVCKLIDSWLDKIVSGQLNNEDIAYDNSDGLWCSVAHMQELVLGNPIGAEVCLLRFQFFHQYVLLP